MRDLIKVALARLRQIWRKVVAIHLIYTGLGVIFFVPLLGVLGQLLLKLSGNPAVADMDLLFFVLSPTGAFAVSLFVAVTIVVSAFELASLMAVGVAHASGKPIDVFAAVKFSAKRTTPIFLFAMRLVVKVLITVAPFLLIAAAVAFFLLADYDINYYLTVQPAEFWITAIVVGLIVVAMLSLLISRLINWSLALPLVLFAGTPPAQAFSTSTGITQQSRGRILRTLIVWSVTTLLLGVVITIGLQVVAAFLVPGFTNSVTLLAIVFGLLTTFWFVASVAATAIASGVLALLLAALTAELEPGLGEIHTHPGIQDRTVPEEKNRRKFAIVLIAAAGAATFTGFELLDEIQVTDDVRIIAHRGASGAAPENTMAAINRAIVDGADWIEIDVQETADGEVVVIHDSDFMKLAGVNLRVWEATMEQLAGIDIGRWFAPEFAGERVPKLADVLAAVKGRSRLIVELKYYGHDQQLEQRVIDLIEAAGMQDETMIMSLKYAGIQKVRALRPDWKTGLLSARAIGNLTRLDADFLAVSLALARPNLVRTAHAAGKEVFVWTVNDALSMSQMMSLGVDGVITDEPLLGREVLQARAELNSVQRLLLHMAPLFGFEAPSLSIESNDANSDGANIDLQLSRQ